MRHETVSVHAKARLIERRASLDPVVLLHTIRETQSALAAIVHPEVRPTPQSESLERFLAGLSDRWRQDEPASSQPRNVKAPRPGEPGRTLSKGCGAKCPSGCRRTRTPAR